MLLSKQTQIKLFAGVVKAKYGKPEDWLIGKENQICYMALERLRKL
jgi:hypothetical protein